MIIVPRPAPVPTFHASFQQPRHHLPSPNYQSGRLAKARDVPVQSIPLPPRTPPRNNNNNNNYNKQHSREVSLDSPPLFPSPNYAHQLGPQPQSPSKRRRAPIKRNPSPNRNVNANTPKNAHVPFPYNTNNNANNNALTAAQQAYNLSLGGDLNMAMDFSDFDARGGITPSSTPPLTPSYSPPRPSSGNGINMNARGISINNINNVRAFTQSLPNLDAGPFQYPFSSSPSSVPMPRTPTRPVNLAHSRSPSVPVVGPFGNGDHRYANSKFQNSPPPKELPKPKFLSGAGDMMFD